MTWVAAAAAAAVITPVGWRNTGTDPLAEPGGSSLGAMSGFAPLKPGHMYGCFRS